MSTDSKPWQRSAWMLAAWSLLLLATPGLLARGGSLVLATVALVPWGLSAARAGRRAFVVEWLAAGIGLSAQCWWSTYVTVITLLAVAIVPAFYVALSGVLLRRAARVVPLALAVPAAWIGFETLRGVIEPPFGFGWMRLGHHASDQPWLLGAARVVGVGGIGFAMAALAGAIGDVIRARAEKTTVPWALVGALGLAPLIVCAVCAAVTAPPPSVIGPRILLVQPDIKQQRKMESRAPDELFTELLDLTRRGLSDAKTLGGAPDLVVWSETMLPFSVGSPDLLAAYDRGARTEPWAQWQLSREDVEYLGRVERELVVPTFFGGHGHKRLLPESTSFLSGVEEYSDYEGRLRRANAAILWDAHGLRAGRAGKVHPVPGGETLVGLERIKLVRDCAQEIGGYVPDFIAADATSVLEFVGHDGHRFGAGVTICFDNAFDGPYTEPLRRGALDLHVVLSNEAWYPGTFEYDQMMAFSRCIAATTGRALVRATNSGITALVGPDGGEIRRLFVDGRDRDVAGELIVDVPVPAAGHAAERTPYVALEHGWIALWIALPFAIGWWGRKPRHVVTARVDPGRARTST